MGQVPLGPLLGNQNIQAKDVYSKTILAEALKLKYL